MWEEEYLEEEYPEDEVLLDRNLSLDFNSIAAKQGHFGSSTDYIAAERKVVHKRWGARRRFFDLIPPKILKYEPEYLDVPAWIQTEEQLLDYIERERSGWIMHRRRRDRRGR